MRDSDFHGDLEYLYSALLMHPSLLIDEQKRKQFEELYQANRKEQFTYGEFIDAATTLTTFFKDGHTNIELPYTAEDRCIHLRCQWDEKDCKQLVLSEQYEDLPEGTQIHSINGKTIEEIIQLLSHRIPHENCYLVKSRMIRYPYQNYHVFSKMNLRWLFGEQADYEIVFLVNGEIVKKQCQLTNYDGFLDFSDENKFVSYDIQGNMAILHLDSCICNETYKKTLEELADLCDKKQLTSLVLDLSKNMGGSSAVIDEFFRAATQESVLFLSIIQTKILFQFW